MLGVARRRPRGLYSRSDCDKGVGQERGRSIRGHRIPSDTNQRTMTQLDTVGPENWASPKLGRAADLSKCLAVSINRIQTESEDGASDWKACKQAQVQLARRQTSGGGWTGLCSRRMSRESQMGPWTGERRKPEVKCRGTGAGGPGQSGYESGGVSSSETHVSDRRSRGEAKKNRESSRRRVSLGKLTIPLSVPIPVQQQETLKCRVVDSSQVRRTLRRSSQ